MQSSRLWFVVLAVTASSTALADEPKKADRPKLPDAVSRAVSFQADVAPLLSKNCLACHSDQKRKGGLSLSTKAGLTQGGDTGAVVVVGKSAESRLIHLVAGVDAESKMPPDGAALSAEQIGVLRAWIDRGADWPVGVTLSGKDGPTPKHWAFEPITRPHAPPVRGESWVRNTIDRFILARIEQAGSIPSVEADRTTLIRRVYLDVTGLPPTPNEVREFLADPSMDAYERMVERALASPHYGERWGRHWLDAARYADSDGYEKDTGRPWAWRYRQWVIDSWNDDLPYDRFVTEQLAGDLLPGGGQSQKIATGFHRNTLTNKEGGVDQEEYRVAAVVDRVNTTGKVFLGLTVSCCQCHDHKYDPISQREFYRLFAYFDNDREVDIDAPLPDESAALKEREKLHGQRRKQLEKSLTDYEALLPKLRAEWEAGLTAEAKTKLPKPVAAALAIAAGKRTDAQVKTIADHFAKSDTKHTQLKNAITNHDKVKPTVSKAPTLAAGTGRKTHVMIRGDFLRKGVEVRPGTPRALPETAAARRTGDRRELAAWIVDPANPLTRRVIVNWVWQKFFGRGLVATLEDFGVQGEKPSHPELLDHLASTMLDDGWSLKNLHRRILHSATYRQSSRYRSDLKDRDPQNILLARQNRLRLEAETVRDAALSASGLLSRRIGGPSIRPPQPSGISELTYANSARWVESTGPDRNRRGLYIWFQRTSPYPMLMTFDAGDSNVCTVRRERSNTPLQALTLLNDPVFVECARAFGNRSAGSAGSDRERLAEAFQTCTGRQPGEREARALQEMLSDLRKLAADSPAPGAVAGGDSAGAAERAAWVALARSLLNLDEFVTRE